MNIIKRIKLALSPAEEMIMDRNTLHLLVDTLQDITCSAVELQLLASELRCEEPKTARRYGLAQQAKEEARRCINNLSLVGSVYMGYSTCPTLPAVQKVNMTMSNWTQATVGTTTRLLALAAKYQEGIAESDEALEEVAALQYLHDKLVEFVTE